MMGDRNGVTIGQEVHTRILEAGGVFENADEKLVYGEPTPSGRLWAGVHIDDLGLLQICSKEE